MSRLGKLGQFVLAMARFAARYRLAVVFQSRMVRPHWELSRFPGMAVSLLQTMPEGNNDSKETILFMQF